MSKFLLAPASRRFALLLAVIVTILSLAGSSALGANQLVTQGVSHFSQMQITSDINSNSADTYNVLEAELTLPADTATAQTYAGVKVSPTFRSVSGATDTVYGLNVGNVTDNTGITSWGLRIGTGWDHGLDVNSGGANITGTLAVVGDFSVSGATTFTVAPDLTIVGTQRVSGAAIDGSLVVSGTTGLQGAVAISGTTDMTAHPIVNIGNASTDFGANGDLTTALGITITSGVVTYGTTAESGPIRYGVATNVISGTTVAHGLGTTPTSIVLTMGTITNSITNTLTIIGSSSTVFTIGVPGGAITIPTVYWMAGK